ncbi:MAG: hypothetical protein ACD_23C00925G0002 [uncultured bacterium]|nr:MAG: hypothetical protein ACD_23C00925G0002 [uncultured bacterium]
MIDLDFHAIYALLNQTYLLYCFEAEMRKGVNGLANLRLHQAAQFHDAGRNAVEFAVELR